MQDGYGPEGWLHGMDDPRTWVHALATYLTSTEPRARATTGRLPSGLTGVMLTLAGFLSPSVHVLLVPHPERVRVRVWLAAWVDDPPVVDHQVLLFIEVVRTVLLVMHDRDPTPVVLVLRPAAPETAADDG